MSTKTPAETPDQPMPDGLNHSSDADPGIRRRVRGRGFSFHDDSGERVSCETTLARIHALAIPPAWREVWICADARGHIQATGVDGAGRKQYRYHELWRAHRDQLKFASLSEFGDALPALRARVRRDLGRNQPDKRFVCAALVRLLDRTALRVGTDAYARTNHTYGATTLRMKHVKLDPEALRLDFRAKGGKRVRLQVGDRTLHRALERIGDLRGYELFHYLDADGERRNVHSQDVNAYLSETLEHGTAKTFRTWRGTVEAFDAASEAVESGGELTIKAMCGRASAVLQNTPAICRKSYIHPAVIGLADAEPEARAQALAKPLEARRDGLRAREAGLLAFLDTV